eukprot:7075754-Pyramimonas_sp.AAC.1
MRRAFALGALSVGSPDASVVGRALANDAPLDGAQFDLSPSGPWSVHAYSLTRALAGPGPFPPAAKPCRSRNT